MEPRRQVLLVANWMTKYHASVCTSLRDRLAESGIRLEVVHGDPPAEIASRGHTASLGWAVRRPVRLFRLGGQQLVWQQCGEEALSSDLVIVGEGGRQLLNYWLLSQQRRGRLGVAFWGHGGNLNAHRASKYGERAKQRMFRLPHWWFAYTEGSKRRIADLGYPLERITVTQNAIFAESLREEIEQLECEDEACLRAELSLGTGPIGLFLGSLYEGKRLDYLIQAADAIVRSIPEFRLVIGGEGPASQEVRSAASARPYVHVVGRLDGRRKALHLKAADVLLLPGLVGLAIVDAFAGGLPTITTAIPSHGPEIEYLRHEENGVMLTRDATAAEYASEVVELLTNRRRYAKLAAGAGASGSQYTGAVMVRRFAEGIELALAAESRRASFRCSKPRQAQS